MPGCDVIGAQKPSVWKDDDGWVCEQVTFCRRCKAVSFEHLAEESTWTEAMTAAGEARVVDDC